MALGQSKEDGLATTEQSPFSLKTKFGKFFGIFSKKKTGISESLGNEEFSEITQTDMLQASWLPGQQRVWSRARGGVVSAEQRRNIARSVGREEMRERGEEVGVEAEEEEKEKEEEEGGEEKEKEEERVTEEEEEKKEEEEEEAEGITGDYLVGVEGTLHYTEDMWQKTCETEREEDEEEVDNGERGRLTPTFSWLVGDSEDTRLMSESGSNVRPASFPSCVSGSGGRIMRCRSSHSDSIAHTVYQVQERLQRLAESTKERSVQEVNEADPAKESSCTLRENQEENEASLGSVPVLMPEVDSSNTLVGSSPNAGFLSHYMVSSCSTNPPDGGTSPWIGSLHNKGERLFMRRVSVCGRKGVNFGTQMAMLDVSNLQFQPSPVALLDQLVSQGEVVHQGDARDIPLTELEGIDWFRFGGCPHSEELGKVHSQLALLHSQLLFERHQCLQHARRNRRLLRKASNARRVIEERDFLVRREEGGNGMGCHRLFVDC